MVKKHFQKTTEDSFFGHFLYEQIIPKNHFLVQLKRIIPWERFMNKLLPYYKGEAEYGRSPINPVSILKILFLTYLYNISERQTEEFVDFNLPAKFFVGLGVDEKAPDHATLTVFKDRLIRGAGLLAYEAIFNEIIKIALEKGVIFGSIQIIDSTHTIANVNLEKDRIRKTKGKPPRDSSASFGVKRLKKIKGEDGVVTEVKDSFYGYKSHKSLNSQSELITSVKVSPGNRNDNLYFQDLVRKDLRKNIPIQAVTADRAYDDGDNITFCEVRGIKPAINLKDKRINSRSYENNQRWRKLMNEEYYLKTLKQRKKIERKFGEEKKHHGLSKARYLGLMKYAVQSYFTAMAVNLKRIVTILTGATLRNQSYVFAYG